MKVPFPDKWQYAQNLTNKSPEATDRINKWVESHGGSVEHLTTEQVRVEVIPLLKKD